MSEEAIGDWPPFWVHRMSGGKRHGRHLRPEDFERLAGLRHMRGGPFGGPPFGGRGRRRRGDVRAAILLLLGEEPRNGYQLMQTIEERSGARWRPSPGAMYPALALLEDEGLIRAVERDGSKLYELTDAGRTHLEERGDIAAPWDADNEPVGTSMRELRRLIGQTAQAVMQVAQAGDEAQIGRACEQLQETRRAMYRILAEDAQDDGPRTV